LRGSRSCRYALAYCLFQIHTRIAAATFKSEEMVLNGNGTYPLQILYSLTSMVADQNSKENITKYGALYQTIIWHCPGLAISAGTALGVSIESCETANGTLMALIRPLRGWSSQKRQGWI